MLGLRVASMLVASCSVEITEQREQPDIGFVWEKVKDSVGHGAGCVHPVCSVDFGGVYPEQAAYGRA
jgi:hypothetical protein